jgi:hypothetical protein
MMIKLIGQSLGILAMAFNILSYQSKKARGVIFMQLFGASLFAASFLMLEQYVGGILNIIAAIRAILFYFKKQTKIDRAGWIPVFIASYLAVYAATFLWLGQEPTVRNFIIEILPVLGMTATTIAYRFEDAGKVRQLGLISSATWLIYNANAHAIGAIICEVLSLGSIFIGMLRLDRKK